MKYAVNIRGFTRDTAILRYGRGALLRGSCKLTFLNTSPLKLITEAESRDDAAYFDDGLIDPETLYMLRQSTLHMLCDRTQTLHDRIHSIFENLLLKQYGKINFAFPSEDEFYDILIKASKKQRRMTPILLIC